STPSWSRENCPAPEGAHGARRALSRPRSPSQEGSMRIRFVVGGLVAALVSAVAVLGASAHGTQISPVPAFTPQDLVAPAGSNWLSWNGSIFNQRYSTLGQVSVDNISGLKLAW